MAQAACPENGRGQAVLFVEDDAITREDVARTISSVASVVHVAGDGREGLEAYLRLRPEIVVTDLRMPGMDGLDLCRRIRREDPHAYIIVASAYGDMDNLFESINIGVDSFVRKPIETEQLTTALRRAMDDPRRGPGADHRLLDHSPDFLLTTDGERVHYLNRSLRRFLGLDAGSGTDAGGLVNRLLRGKPPGGGRPPENWLRELTSLGERELVLTMDDPMESGDNRAVLVRNRCLPTGNGHAPLFSVSFTDVTHIQRERDFYLDLALKDPLTGTANRARFFDELRRECWRADRYCHPLSLLMFDLDDFKRVNDEFGHRAGDHVLAEVAGLVSARIRKVDIFARYGGEEFFIIAPDTPLPGGTELAEKLRRAIAGHDFGRGVGVTCSFGVVSRLVSEPTQYLLERADSALYRAKLAGKNRTHTAAPR
ncbi:diguanylate cyclase [Desulfohalovibrio reitneri]|uniref:diguanylate cyclase n=1 Tax=Desulfohalovibrio reitneri TaxID=1307759 RepID=UPI00068B2A24|nr:diguanylate cyclase [Desulfohalovibrio reitneri]